MYSRQMCPVAELPTSRLCSTTKQGHKQCFVFFLFCFFSLVFIKVKYTTCSHDGSTLQIFHPEVDSSCWVVNVTIRDGWGALPAD